jgi:hypothetical protein
MVKAKAGRPKHVRPHDTKLNVPTDPLKNEVKRLYWALLEMEKRMSKDITSVKMKDYTDLLSAYRDRCEILKAKGYVGRYAKQRVDEQRVVQDGQQDTASGVGENESSQLGVGVPSINPIA